MTGRACGACGLFIEGGEAEYDAHGKDCDLNPENELTEEGQAIVAAVDRRPNPDSWPVNQPQPRYCDAKSNENYRITHPAVPNGRVLVCAKCSATFDWWSHQDHLPHHVASNLHQTKDEIIASFEKGAK